MNEPVNDKAPKDSTACPEWGRGGSYTRDPVTGVRTLVERTDAAQDALPAAADAAAVKTVKKGA